MEHKINEVITYNHEGETIYLKVTPVKDNTCKGCFFQGKCNIYWRYIKYILGNCDKIVRSDNTHVIFKRINNKLMKNITLEEARELYKQGGIAKEIALRAYTEKEIVNDYTLITSLPKESTCTTTDLYAKLKTVYKEISKGREVNLTNFNVYTPIIAFSSNNFKPNNYGECVSKVLIDNIEFSIYISTHNPFSDGKLGYENDGVYCGSRLLENTWAFKEREQAKHFVKFFYKELILLSLADEHKVEFI